MTKANARAPLLGRCIGISISESPDLGALGLGEVHLQDAMVEFARHILAGGARLAYGGDLRPGGFTQILFDLAGSYRPAAPLVGRSVVNYLAWPIHLQLLPATRAHLLNVAELRELSPPAGLGVDPTSFLAPSTPENRFTLALSLREMRETMSRETDARILLGGRLDGYQGLMPGLLEEAWLALRERKPLFLLGGFGGCTAAIVAALRGERPRALTSSFQLNKSTHRELLEYYNARVKADSSLGEPFDHDSMLENLEQISCRGLNNGLDESDIERLGQTVFIPEMISLVLKGLARCFLLSPDGSGA